MCFRLFYDLIFVDIYQLNLFYTVFLLIILYLFSHIEGDTYMGTTCTEAVYIYKITCDTWTFKQILYAKVVSGLVPSIVSIEYGYSLAVNARFLTVGVPYASKYYVHFDVVVWKSVMLFYVVFLFWGNWQWAWLFTMTGISLILKCFARLLVCYTFLCVT